MMSEKEWIERTTKYDLGKCPFHNRPVTIESRGGKMNGTRKWVLRMHEWVLGKDAEFHYEPTPSNRTDEFMENTRFDSPNECHTFWVENIKSTKV